VYERVDEAVSHHEDDGEEVIPAAEVNDAWD